MQARIREKQEVAKGTLMVTFDLLGNEVDFRPGQYFYVTLPDVGHQDEKGLRRHITVVTSPNDRDVLGLATRMRNSAFKRTLGELPIDAAVDIEQPEGDFGLPEETTRPLVFVAGGIGITVFRSMLRYIHEEQLAYRITLIYTNRDPESTAFLNELRNLEQQLPDFRLILTMTQDPSWEGDTRKIDAQFPPLPRTRSQSVHVPRRRPAGHGKWSARRARGGRSQQREHHRRGLQRLLRVQDRRS